MNQHTFLFFLMFFLALLCALCWPHHGPAQSRAAAKRRTRLHRLRHHVQCSTRHSLVPVENPLAPDRHGADHALAEGLDPSAAERVQGYRQATITNWLSRAGEHAQTLHARFFQSSIPVPRTQNMAHAVIHSLRQFLAALLHPPFHQ